MGRWPRGSWGRPNYLGVGCAFANYSIEDIGVGCGCLDCRVEVMCGWGRGPRFALEYVELVGAWFFSGVVWFTSPVRLGIDFFLTNRHISVFLKPNPIYIGIHKSETDKSDTI